MTMPSGPTPVWMVATAVRVFPSTTVTVLLLWLTMYALFVVSLTATAMGCRPVLMFWETVCASARMQVQIARAIIRLIIRAPSFDVTLIFTFERRRSTAALALIWRLLDEPALVSSRW